MGKQIYWQLVLLCLLTLVSVSAYQQGHLVFELDSWEIAEQFSNRQAFEKNNMLLDIRASQGTFIEPEQYAQQINGRVESQNTYGDVWEAVIIDDENVFIFARKEHDDHTYLLTLRAPLSQLNQAKSEMKTLYDSLSFSSEAKYVEAPWEKELKEPGELPFLTKHPVPWGWIILFVVLFFIAWWIIRKKRRKSKKKK